MMKTKIWVLSFVLGLLSLSAQAQNSFIYTTNNSAITITGYTGSSNSVTIPDVINGYPVTSIGDWAFYHSSLTNVTIPGTVTYIGYAAFNGSTLRSVTIPNSVTALGDYAFYDCSVLTNVVLSTNLTSISGSAFAYDWNLTSITIPNSVTNIRAGALADCGLTSITIPASVTSLGDEVFRYDLQLTNVTFLGNAPALGGTNVFVSDNNVTVYYYYPATGWGPTFAGRPVKELNVPFGYSVNNGGVTITGYSGTNTAVTIPPIISGYPVVGIALQAFYGNLSIRSLVIPDTVTAIAGGSEHSRVVSSGSGWYFEYWYDGAFYRCSNLTSVVIGSGLTSLGTGAFSGCARLTNVTFLGNAPASGSHVFDIGNTYEGLDPVTVYYYYPATGWGTTYNGRPAVELGLPFTYVVTNGKVTITSYTGDGGVMTIPDAINGYPVAGIGTNAFTNSKLTSITIPNGVTSIGANAFQNCSGLTNVILSASVATIADSAFANNTNLIKITFLGNPPVLGSNAFNGDNAATVYYYYGIPGWGATFGGVPTAMLSPFIYTVADNTATLTGYTGLISAITIPSTFNSYPLANIGTNAFNGCASLTSVVIPNSVTNISDSAFANCANLTSVSIPDSVTSIGGNAFYACASLPAITIPDSVTNIGGGAFRSCGGLRGVVFSDNLMSISDWVFAGSSLTNVTIPNSVTNIGSHAFDGCENLTNVTLSTNLVSIGDNAFSACWNLTHIDLPTRLTSIGQHAFLASLNGANVTLPDSMTSIGDNAFQYCSMSSLTIPGSVVNIGNYAFDSCYQLTSVAMSNGVTAINEGAFANCLNLTSVTIPDSVTYLGPLAFMSAPLTSVSIPKGITEIYPDTFAYSAITSVVIPTGVTTIDSAAFLSCYWLTNVVIPASVTYLGEQAFYDCESLTNVTFLGNAPDGTIFSFGNNGLSESVPLTVRYYYGTSGWGTNGLESGEPQAGYYLTQQGIIMEELTWTPPVGGAGVQGGNFGFNFVNTNGLPVVVEASTNLVDWHPVWTNRLSGNITNFVDPQWTRYPARFYRAL